MSLDQVSLLMSLAASFVAMLALFSSIHWTKFERKDTELEKKYEKDLQYHYHIGARLEHKVDTLSHFVNEVFYLLALGAQPGEIISNRLIPVRLGTKGTLKVEEKEEIEDALMRFVKAFELEIIDTYPDQYGSWGKRWWARVMGNPVESSEETLNAMRRALELKGLYGPQSEVNRNHAAAVQTLLQSVEKIPTVAMHVGSILLVKTAQGVQVKTLTMLEMAHLEKNQHWLMDPQSILDNLSTSKAEATGLLSKSGE